ncbi:predicted protein [Chaetomium globosum CBS 148.51]|uniref:Uncharacterized protein n=1 Tax=Chaetomium globosum (strain ATCC 6205 / CBS 148.51 / DSM 1962 / NBRC 6347 / NRRL 1970) TaxID=306901 RepID=Q2HCJ4_CHAGB|nr:uncharacterized protein CHGG_02060 [Chaetomium globosum CBS 148.51]EAQ93825.1 predicted protein [Chaetomium globosum CBS 148.51]
MPKHMPTTRIELVTLSLRVTRSTPEPCGPKLACLFAELKFQVCKSYPLLVPFVRTGVTVPAARGHAKGSLEELAGCSIRR